MWLFLWSTLNRLCLLIVELICICDDCELAVVECWDQRGAVLLSLVVFWGTSTFLLVQHHPDINLWPLHSLWLHRTFGSLSHAFTIGLKANESPVTGHGALRYGNLFAPNLAVLFRYLGRRDGFFCDVHCNHATLLALLLLSFCLCWNLLYYTGRDRSRIRRVFDSAQFEYVHMGVYRHLVDLFLRCWHVTWHGHLFDSSWADACLHIAQDWWWIILLR